VSLLQEIQAALMEEGRDIGPIFLKLRFLAERLGSSTSPKVTRTESRCLTIERSQFSTLVHSVALWEVVLETHPFLLT